MKLTSTSTQRISRTAIAMGALALMASFASAGECPADKVKQGARTSGETMPVGVTDTVIASIDLSPKGEGFKDNLMRMRKLVIAPGGVVPWHEHSERPANIYILAGEIEEYRSSCEVPIVHKAGEVVMEYGKDHAHWWKNISDKPVELISADIVHMEKKSDPMM